MSIGFTVVTRFGVGVEDSAWFEGRFRLFEAITLPSLSAQSNQEFSWLFFVGRKPIPWVTERLSFLLQRFGQRAKLIYETPNVGIINEYSRNRAQDHAVIANIDDDDAWHKEVVSQALADAASFLNGGHNKVAFTYPDGYEWLVTDIIDLDALNKTGRLVVRKQSCFPYRRPFHSMSCFTLAPTGECFEGFFSLHSSKGEIARSFNYEVQELDYPAGKAWLYARHQQADSAVHKAWANPPAPVSIEYLEEEFGIDKARVEDYQQKARNLPYSLKRTHKLADKRKLTFTIEQLIRSDLEE